MRNPLVILLAALPMLAVAADTPTAYTMTSHSNLFVAGEVDQVSCDGSKEVVDQMVNGGRAVGCTAGVLACIPVLR